MTDTKKPTKPTTKRTVKTEKNTESPQANTKSAKRSISVEQGTDQAAPARIAKYGTTEHIQEPLAFAPSIQTDYTITHLEQNSLEHTFQVVIAGEYLNKVLADFLHTQADREKPKIAGFGKKIPTPVLMTHYIKKFKDNHYQGASNLFDYVLITEVTRAVEYAKARFQLGETLRPDFTSVPARANAGSEKPNYQYSDYTFTFTIEQIALPTELVDLKTVKVLTPVTTVTDADTQVELANWAAANKKAVPLTKARPVKLGDTVEITLTLANKKEQLDKVRVIVGEGKLNPDCENQLIGKNVGESFEYDFRLPTDYADQSVAGRSYHIILTVDQIFDTVQHQVDHDMATQLGFSNLEECAESFRQQLQDAVDQQIFFVQRASLREQIAQCNLHISPKLRGQDMLARHDVLAKQINQNITYPVTADIAKTLPVDKVFGFTYDTWLKHAEHESTVELKADAALKEFARMHKIVLNQDDLDKAIAALAHQSKRSLKETLQHYEQNPQELAQVRSQAYADKVARLAILACKLDERKMTLAQLKDYVWIGTRPNATLAEKAAYGLKA